MKLSGRLAALWAGLRHPWVAFFTAFYLVGLVFLSTLRQTTALHDVLLSMILAAVGLGVMSWFTLGEGSRPGPTPRPLVGFLLAVVLTIVHIVRPQFVPLPMNPGLIRDMLGNLIWLGLLPAAILLLSGASWKSLGLRSFLRTGGRWRSMAWVLVAALTLPALIIVGRLALFQQEPFWRLLLALLASYAYAWLARALPEEFLYRQVLQPSLQSLLRDPAAAIIVQALLFGLSAAGLRLARGEPWPLALLVATLEGGLTGVFYGLLRDRTGSLAMPVFIHAWVTMWFVLPQVILWMPR